MMIVVAILGVAMGAQVMKRRHDAFRLKANLHAVEEKAALQSVEDLRQDEQQSRESLASPAMARNETTIPMDLRDRIKQRRLDLVAMRARAEWHGQMGRKYAYAASHPWLTVAADPPAPPPIPEWVVRNAIMNKAFDKVFKNMFKQ
jgi:predicted nucleic acid-binding Zn ribbon protein